MIAGKFALSVFAAQRLWNGRVVPDL